MVLDDVDLILRLVDLAAEKETRERAAVIIVEILDFPLHRLLNDLVVSNNRRSFLLGNASE